MRAYDLYKQAEAIGPNAVKFMFQYFLGGVSMEFEGFTDSTSRQNYPHAKWCMDQLELAFAAIPDDEQRRIEMTQHELITVTLQLPKPPEGWEVDCIRRIKDGEPYFERNGEWIFAGEGSVGCTRLCCRRIYVPDPWIKPGWIFPLNEREWYWTPDEPQQTGLYWLQQFGSKCRYISDGPCKFTVPPELRPYKVGREDDQS